MLITNMHLRCDTCKTLSDPLTGRPHLYRVFAMAKDLATSIYPEGWSIEATFSPPIIWHFCSDECREKWLKKNGKKYGLVA